MSKNNKSEKKGKEEIKRISKSPEDYEILTKKYEEYLSQNKDYLPKNKKKSESSPKGTVIQAVVDGHLEDSGEIEKEVIMQIRDLVKKDD